MSRLGAILIPLLAGFLVTMILMAWRSGSWELHEVREAAAIPATSIEPVRAPPRVRHVALSAVVPGATAPSHAAASAAAATATAATDSATPEAVPEAAAETLAGPPIPRADPGNSPEQLEAPARKFARGSDSSGD